VIVRAIAGLALAGIIAVVARRTGVLSASGAVAAIAVGTACMTAGWSWGGLLIAFFVASTLLTRSGAARKVARTEGIVEKAGERDAVQVLANGGVFALAALGTIVAPWWGWMPLGAGALAAATADTWGTELGTLAAARPRSIRSLRPVPAGTSGGVTIPGTAASLAGAAFIAGSVLLLGWPAGAAWGALAGGVVGSTTDSLLGASVQSRRWCERCDEPTERRVHLCGAVTRRAGGLGWLDNDAVNVGCALVGAMVALAVAR
jgi:uncharacterized protein (TIGR00297 family)